MKPFQSWHHAVPVVAVSFTAGVALGWFIAIAFVIDDEPRNVTARSNQEHRIVEGSTDHIQ